MGWMRRAMSLRVKLDALEVRLEAEHLLGKSSTVAVPDPAGSVAVGPKGICKERFGLGDGAEPVLGAQPQFER